jgi:serine/threonine protein kinase
MPEKNEIADNYEIIEQIAETHKSIVYRAKDKTNQQIVILKSFKKKYPSFWELAQIRQENKLVQSLEYPGVVKSLGLIWKDDSIFISFEDTKGESLKNCIQKNFISMSSFLDLGIRLADTLAFIHSKGIIHKDIKPHNIIVRYVDNEFKDVRLTDFGLSVIQNDDIQSFYNPKAIEGTLPYISPEQSGRMNLSIDYRTDFYSLGITLYEVLAGELPFASNDPIELIHSHIARTPPPIQDKQKREIPEAVAGIIYKLLAKSPEDRYQNAGSLKKEFEYCKEHYNKKGSINHFKPGMMDVADRFIIPQKIIGRDVEIQSLLNVFDKVQNGSREVMLVSGSPGIGKSRLIYEVQKPILKARGYFFSGKYDKMRKDVPFSSLIQSFQALIKQILTESEERIFVWKKKILENINQNGKIIIQVIPELEYIIGEQPDVPDVSTEESHNRFNYTFLKFIKVFATKEHPLTLFLDDIQWADLASIHLLQEIILDSELKYFFLICAYRLEEVSEFHPFHKMIQNISKKDVQVNKIFLNPLNSEYVYGFLAHLMGEKSAKIQEVAELLYSKTHGNPFFLTQFIKNLYDEKIIHYDNIESIWFCDIEKIRELNVTENVIDLMVNRINSLPEESKNLLKMAACIGNRFSLELLSALYGKNYEETLEVLDPLLREGFVVSNGDLYRFLHDRIQEASYSLVKPEEKIGIHTLIGYITLTDLKDGELNEKIFYITDQLNHGRTQIYFESEKENLAQFRACPKIYLYK